MTVAELELKMSTREFVEWIAFYAAEAKEREAEHKKAEQKARASRMRRR